LRFPPGLRFPQELRRGSQPATIHSIALSKYCEWLAVSSDKDTVHVWALSSAVATGREAPAAGQNGANNGGGGQGGALGGAYGASGGQQQGGGADAPAGAKNASLAVVSALKVRGVCGAGARALAHSRQQGGYCPLG
jgi:hypothetical protein